MRLIAGCSARLECQVEDGQQPLGEQHRVGQRAPDTALRKARLWQSLDDRPVDERHWLVLKRMLGDGQGFLTTSKYMVLAKYSADTAQRDLGKLLERGALFHNAAGGRSTSYRLR